MSSSVRRARPLSLRSRHLSTAGLSGRAVTGQSDSAAYTSTQATIQLNNHEATLRLPPPINRPPPGLCPPLPRSHLSLVGLVAPYGGEHARQDGRRGRRGQQGRCRHLVTQQVVAGRQIVVQVRLDRLPAERVVRHCGQNGWLDTADRTGG